MLKPIIPLVMSRKTRTALLMLFLVVADAYTKTRALPGVTISGVDIGFWTREEAQAYLIRKTQEPIRIQIRDQQRILLPTEIGIRYDLESVLNRAYSFNTVRFPHSSVLLLKYFIRSPNFSIPLHFEPTFDDAVRRHKDEVYVSENHTLAIAEHEHDYTIDPESLKKQIIAANISGQTDILYKPTIIRVQSIEKQFVAEYNKKLNRVFSAPLSVRVLSDTGPIDITLTPEARSPLCRLTEKYTLYTSISTQSD